MKFIKPDWPAPDNVMAFTTTKSVWGNEITSHKSQEERDVLRNLLPLPADPIWINQTHSNIAIEASTENLDKEADASFANKPDTVCVVCTADCLPILLCDKDGTHVSAIHAGWRGLANGIVETTLKAMAQPSNDLMAWLGPAIGPEKFEVGEDVYLAFTSQHSASARAFKPYGNQKWLADLYELARVRLQRAGLNRIYGGNFCTYSQPDLFHSYRRDKGKTGRMASLIWRT